MSQSLYKCPFCARKYYIKDALYEHMDSKHSEDLCGLSPKQVFFNYRNHYELTRGNGKSVISGKPTKFNEITGRYERFLPEEKEQYREYFLKNMKRAGKENIMKDMQHQKELLAARSISGKYRWSDGSAEFVYTGSYEKKFLQYLDTMLNWPSSDLMAPAPQLFPYHDVDNAERIHIPDFYISSLNLIVNIKSSSNQHYRLRDIETERLQDEAVKNTNYNYIKIYDNQFDKFLKGIEEIKENLETNKTKKVIVESFSLKEDDTIGMLLESAEDLV